MQRWGCFGIKHKTNEVGKMTMNVFKSVCLGVYDGGQTTGKVGQEG